MRFRHYDNLRVFNIVARHSSLGSAASELNLTKGAVSHQIRQLEAELGFEVLVRHPRGISLSGKGGQLLAATQAAFTSVENTIAEIRHADDHTLTIGVTTYFASRWLSSRLMAFMEAHPRIRLRVQPMIDLLDLKGEGIDISIRWGRGDWDDVVIERLFLSPAFATGNREAFERVKENGLEAILGMTLLRDRDDSNAWSHWYERAGLTYHGKADTLIIPDPNVRVQAVMDGQGIAINDELVSDELEQGRLFRLHETAMPDYGYFLAYDPGALNNPDIAAFAKWIKRLA